MRREAWPVKVKVPRSERRRDRKLPAHRAALRLRGQRQSEGLGIALLESIDNDDPTALVGLPLTRTCRMIQAAGVKLLSRAQP